MNRLFAYTLGPLVVLGASACSQPRAAERVDATAPSVSVARVVRGDLEQVLTVSAEFRPFQEIDVHAKVAGYVQAMHVDVGDRVKAGQLLAVLEVPEMRDELQGNEAVVSRAREDINRAQADLERAQSTHEVAHLGAARLDGVMKARPNLVAQQDIDEATGRDRIAEAQVATAKATLASAQQQLQAAKANEQHTRTLLDYAQITAPFAGVITHRYADTGAMIQAGTSSQTQAMSLVKLSQTNVLRLTIPVPESAVAQIHLGEPVSVTVASLGKTFSGTVARFADQLDEQTRTMHTEVDVRNPDLQLVPGMYASAALTLADRRGVLVVPVQAVDRPTDGHASVMVVDASRTLQVRPVTLGLETPDRVEVVSGLRENDLVVLGNRTQLKAGSPATPTPATKK
jgi:RND family efflux transporter MFP subunit